MSKISLKEPGHNQSRSSEGTREKYKPLYFFVIMKGIPDNLRDPTKYSILIIMLVLRRLSQEKRKRKNKKI